MHLKQAGRSFGAPLDSCVNLEEIGQCPRHLHS